jgi:RNA polymerase sigma-70 factor (ECF subfamily)
MQLLEHTDQDLIQAVQAGDDDAFAELMRRHQRPVLNFVYRILGDAAQAEDIAQEAFVRLYRNIGRYDPTAKFSTWLFALARHAAIDHLRWRNRHPAEPLELISPPGARDPSPDERAVHSEIGDEIAAAIAALPEDQRTAIVLSEYHGLAHAEIAAIMRCSAKSVEARLYRARQTLRHHLKHLTG